MQLIEFIRHSEGKSMQTRNASMKSHDSPTGVARSAARSKESFGPEAVVEGHGQAKKTVPTLLHVDDSPRGGLSISRQLSAAAVAAWRNNNPVGRVIVRDLSETKMTFVDLDWIVGSRGTSEQQTDSTKRALVLSDELVAELLEADEMVIGTPMYNFAIPAVLKAWIDYVVRPGKTFAYGAAGPEGLAKGRRAVIAVASGGSYDAASGWDYEIPYLGHILDL
jgi:FMN-dependent NADH-azoreductase